MNDENTPNRGKSVGSILCDRVYVNRLEIEIRKATRFPVIISEFSQFIRLKTN